MSEDHLDKPVAVDVAVRADGFRVAAASRTASAFDRLGGNLAEMINVSIEGWTSRRRARIEGEQLITAAAARRAAELILTDDYYARRAIKTHFDSAMRRQDNKDGVMTATIEDLRDGSHADEGGTDTSEELSEEFLTGIETYSEGASTDELRKKWGRVLSAEIRRPGTFSRKILRVVDEMDSEAARLFEEVCKTRIGSYLPLCTLREMTYPEKLMLVDAGLLIDDEGFVTKPGVLDSDPESPESWVFVFDMYAVQIQKEGLVAQKTFHSEHDILVIEDNRVAMPVAVLTQAGLALTKILHDDQLQALRLLSDKIKLVSSSHAVRKWNTETESYRLLYNIEKE